MVTSPSTQNYTVGKGNVYFTEVGGARRHIGNVLGMEINLEVEELDHFSHMEGIRSKDKSIILEKAGSVRVVMDEITLENLKLALLGGTFTTNTDGDRVMELFATDKVEGRLEFEGSNSVGPVYNVDLPSVAFRPDAAFNPISDEWQQLEVLGEIQISNGSWGTVTEINNNTETA